MKNSSRNHSAPYFRVMTAPDGNTADLYLYGYIGQDKWWEDDPTEPLTDLAVVQAIKQLEKEHNRINVRINSPGGSVMHGDPIITALRSSPAEIHTYVDGIAASMAFDIWVASKNRHAATNSKLMVHATSSIAIGTAEDMRQAAAMLEKFDETSIASMAEATGMDPEEIASRFYDYKDHWLSAKDAKEMGLISEIESYPVSQPADNPEKLSFRQLLTIAGRVNWPTDRPDDPEPEPDETPERPDDFEKHRLEYLEKRGQLAARDMAGI